MTTIRACLFTLAILGLLIAGTGHRSWALAAYLTVVVVAFMATYLTRHRHPNG